MAAMVLGFCLHGAQAKAADIKTLTVAGGCFWCVEADFEKVRGVRGVVSGYTGGSTANPTYKQVTKGGTGHYEAVQITYDADRVSAETLLSMFFRSVDPTDAGGQFCDRGNSYRTAIFAGSAADKAAAQRAKQAAQAALGRNIVTPILGESRFYRAERNHQDYYKKQSEAYKAYRQACGRDARVKQLWGSQAAFVK
ncbi:UNVERIFIED_CONTAM: hypothetical protein GTU68_018666 [Idotea baltica]|nr:hypothetical protein [Idotea baltica]